jgi:hypothetical protein
VIERLEAIRHPDLVPLDIECSLDKTGWKRYISVRVVALDYNKPNEANRLLSEVARKAKDRIGFRTDVKWLTKRKEIDLRAYLEKWPRKKP